MTVGFLPVSDFGHAGSELVPCFGGLIQEEKYELSVFCVGENVGQRDHVCVDEGGAEQ